MTRAMWRALPGPGLFWLWFTVAVSAPLLIYPYATFSEAVTSGSPRVVWWVTAAVAIVSTVTGARLVRFLPSIVVGGVYLLLSWMVFRWAIPMRPTFRHHQPWDATVLFSIPCRRLGPGWACWSHVGESPRVIAREPG